MHGRKGRYRNKRRGLRVNCFCAFGNNVQAFSSSLPRTSKRYSARVSTVGVSKGVNGGVPILELSSPENCPSSVEFPDTLFRYFENFSPFETVTDRGNARFLPRNWTNVQRWERFSRFRSNLSFSSTFASFSSRREPFKRTLLFERLPSGNWIRIFVLSSII